MESAIAKYDHVVQCMRELKQIYRNAEMSETVLSPHKVNFNTERSVCEIHLTLFTKAARSDNPPSG